MFFQILDKDFNDKNNNKITNSEIIITRNFDIPVNESYPYPKSDYLPGLDPEEEQLNRIEKKIDRILNLLEEKKIYV